MKIATVFSGIGSIETAVERVYGKKNREIVFACDTGEREIDKTKEEVNELTKNMSEEDKQKYISKLFYGKGRRNFVKESYVANYKIKDDKWFEDIRFINGKMFKDQVDLFVGGSPCQSFSVIGKRAGLEDARGTLFYDFARLITEMQPKVFLYENVPGMLSHDDGKTWKHIQEIFDSLGYKIFKALLNAMDFGVPQNRKRLYVVGFRNKDIEFEFPKAKKLTLTLNDYLDETIDDKYYFKKKGFEFVTQNPHRARINRKIIQTQKANQQYNWNGDFIFEKLDLNKHQGAIEKGAYVGMYNGEEGLVRKLTPNECFKLMGFNNFVNVVPDMHAYRQAGNSIVVDVLVEILKKIKEVM